MAKIEFSANPTHLSKHPHPQTSPPPPSNRDETRNSVDYISELPIGIILHIFSFLTSKDAIKTSVLSKQWRYIWTANPRISFSMPPCYNRRMLRSFTAIVDVVLLRCTAVKVKSFHFDATRLFYNSWLRFAVGPTFHRWLRFAVKHDIEEVSMFLDHEIYTLPKFFFRCTTMVSFHVSHCHFSMMGAVNWSSLKRLRIDHAKLEDNAITRLLKGCPVLEFFELKGCWGYEHIKIESRGLRELVIDSHKYDFVHGQILKISAPHLLKLRILGDCERGEFKIDKVSSFVEVEVNFKMDYYVSGQLQAQSQGDLVRRLIQSLHHVTKLVMGNLCLQSVTAKEFWDSANQRIYPCLVHLKNVEIVDPGAHWLAWEPVLSLFEFLLQNAPLLDKIKISSSNNSSIYHKVILSHPNRSPCLKVILSYPSQGCPSTRVLLSSLYT
ncbi:F-box/LRR-repeat protein 25 [Eucalyptus grandis]|uniref:F-box/LRR-repeat protein 25 n=1 Tax=Eucalyptus grandis TaxID=71139 RepID=UPI00192EA49C|nr:F-box/LRR-repeat protein 25 [Eucalyptus grandis]